MTTACCSQTELIASIKMCSDILLWTVNDFMDYFKVSAGKSLDVVQTSMNVRDVVVGAMKVCGCGGAPGAWRFSPVLWAGLRPGSCGSIRQL